MAPSKSQPPARSWRTHPLALALVMAAIGGVMVSMGLHLDRMGSSTVISTSNAMAHATNVQRQLAAPTPTRTKAPRPTSASSPTPAPTIKPPTPQPTSKPPSTTKPTSSAPAPTPTTKPTSPHPTTNSPAPTSKSPAPTATQVPGVTSKAPTGGANGTSSLVPPTPTSSLTPTPSTTSTPLPSTPVSSVATPKPSAGANATVTTKPASNRTIATPAPTESAVNGSTTPKPSVPLANGSMTPVPTASVANGSITPVPTSSLANATSVTKSPVNGTVAPTNSTRLSNGTNSTCVPSFCGAKGCMVRRELRAAVGEDGNLQPNKKLKTSIMYSLCSANSFFGQIVSTNVKPTVPVGNPVAANDAAACAMNCMMQAKCQWFTIEGTTCQLFQDILLEAPDAGKAVGFLRAASPDDLNRKVKCKDTERTQMDDSQSDKKITLCRTLSGTMSVVPDQVNECGASPWTLYRGYLNTGKVSATGLINANEFIQAMEPAQKFEAILNNNDVPIDTNDKCNKPLTKWNFRYDVHGRVTSAEGKMTRRNYVKNYRKPVFQQNFNKVHHRKETATTGLISAAGHVVANEFANPNSFWNFVPQAAKSNSGSGCWKNAETQVERLIHLGCEGTFTALLNYFDVGDLKTINQKATEFLTTMNSEPVDNSGDDDVDMDQVDDQTCDPIIDGDVADAEEDPADYDDGDGAAPSIPTVPAPTGAFVGGVLNANVGDVYKLDRTSTEYVSYPCNYFYRPFRMNIHFRITGASEGSACQNALRGMHKNRFFSIDKSTVQSNRALVRWAMNSATSNLTPLMGFATNSANRCLAELGDKFTELQLSKWFKEAFLVDPKTKQCVTHDGVQSGLAKCDPKNELQRWTADDNGVLTGKGGQGQFVYTLDTFVYDGGKQKIKMNDLVQGKATIGGKEFPGVLALYDLAI